VWKEMEGKRICCSDESSVADGFWIMCRPNSKTKAFSSIWECSILRKKQPKLIK
jgi:hypothetical protein